MTTTMKHSHVHFMQHEHHAHVPTHHNVGGLERGARLFVGAITTAAAFTWGAVWLRVILGLIGAGAFATSLGSYCPINRALGHDSYHHG